MEILVHDPNLSFVTSFCFRAFISSKKASSRLELWKSRGVIQIRSVEIRDWIFIVQAHEAHVLLLSILNNR